MARPYLDKLRVPAIHLCRAESSAFSKLGGLPYVPPAFEWPHFRGKPLSFLAQIDLAEVPDPGTGLRPPNSGYLYFFYDQEQSTWGFDPNDRGSWKVVHSNADKATLTTASTPRGLEVVYSEKPIRFAPVLVYPLSACSTLCLEEDEEDAFEELRENMFGDEAAHYLFGVPNPVQGDCMELECQLVSNGIYCGAGFGGPETAHLLDGVSRWKLLLQFDSDEEMDFMCSDVGRLYFWIKEPDWANQNFEDVWMVLQSG